ncbi:PAS domain-containing sensor histidine kinase [Adhaeribacter soli]|uniref:histidine kinase n=1 Tax=Adhaeribacter soli TaxID=2607655 RepID=A0A5N1IJN3_9BACT|nr:ATP-binding protein [Adhaeribacter soli]KAA9325479.1 PAS domain S-box protein [Adhaeribacter soli]
MNLSANPENIFLLEQLAEHTQNAFFIFDVPAQQFTYLSPAYEFIWERNREELTVGAGGLWQAIVPQDRRHVLRCWNWYKAPRRSNHKTFEFRLQFPDGRLKWLYAELYLIRNEDGSFSISGWVQDVSERKQYLEVLRKYAARKNSVLEILTHDLSGFLNLIRSLSLSSNIASPENTREFQELSHKLSLIQETSQRSLELITTLVNHEFIESSKVELNRQHLDLVAKIGDIIDTFRAAEREMDKKFVIEASQPQIFAMIDDVKLMQVINNLVSNAIKFTPDGGIIRIELEDKPEAVQLRIMDNGIGIPDALQPLLFDRFTEARRPGLRGEPAVGLGMSIIKLIVELHNGRIWFSSRENEGSTFFVELPKE